jgi:Histidine phosphatase superfamily (branch 1)
MEHKKGLPAAPARSRASLNIRAATKQNRPECEGDDRRLPLRVRHGETEANEDDIDAGPLDYPLTKKGVKEASFIAKALSKVEIDAVYSSPVLRAVETAKILAAPHKLKVRPWTT